ncbi:MAG TPA: exodeoxyribonuclease VII large subunit [Aliidongia sp.]|nr:exodeoxyribonuclease VII large subunit [Aliidongia sp.]
MSESPSPTPASNVPVYGVGELSGALKRTIEQAYGHVRVRGEISGCKHHGSGHVYLALKDADAVLDAVCWRGTVAKLPIRPAEGIEVIATGRLTTFPGRSKYQLIIEHMELAGEGALLKMLEDRKRMLAAEGLFAEERKRPLPYLPGVIGVITSPTGAVIRDILHRLNERFPRHVLIWPVAVQGEGAAEQVARAIEGFNRLAPGGPVPRPDLLIVARGGGSLEDLMPFNEEIVVRAAAASTIPLISAVGHETDTTLIDFAADRRAPTPTAAAEIAVPVRLDLLAELRNLSNRLDGGAVRLVAERRLRLEGLARGLPEPGRLIEQATQRLDDRAERLDLSVRTLLRDRAARVAQISARLKHPREQIGEATRHLDLISGRLAPSLDRALERFGERLARHAQVLESLSPFKVLERGYAVVEDEAGHPVAPAAIEAGMGLTLRFHETQVAARAESGPQPVGAAPSRTKPARKPKPTEEKRQPTLF